MFSPLFKPRKLFTSMFLAFFTLNLLTPITAFAADADANGLDDDWEALYGECTIPMDGVTAAVDWDYDSDGLSSLAEYNAGTSPCVEDTDEDGLSDGEELDRGTDPITRDLPDFYISDITYYQLGVDFVSSIPTGSDPADYVIYFTIANGGGNVTDLVDLDTAYNETLDSSAATLIQHSFSFMGDASFMNAGGSSRDNAEEITVGLLDVTSTPELGFCADTENDFAESDDGNNCTYIPNPFYVDSALPDLTVTNVEVDPTDYSLDITVTNNGAGADDFADPTLGLLFETPVSTSPVLEYNINSYGTEGFDYHVAGGSTIVTLPLGGDEAEDVERAMEEFEAYCDGATVEDSTWTITATADYFETLEESNEINNVLVSTFDICESARDDGTLPDLEITSITLNSENRMEITVQNNGTGEVDSSLFPVVNIYDLTNGDGSAVETEFVPETGNYREVGGQVVFTSGYILPSTSEVSILAVVDATGDVEELSEDNDYRVTFNFDTSSTGGSSSSSSSSETTGGGGAAPGGSSSHGSSSSSNNDEDVELSGSEEVTLTEEEAAACGEMTFTDVESTDAAYESIYALWCEGVIHGRDSLHFAPSDNIKRDEATKVAGRLFGYVTTAHEDLPEVTETSYSDVSTSEPLAYYIEVMTDEGFYDDEAASGEFRPHEDMSYAEIVDLLEQASGLDVEAEGYESDDGMSRGAFIDLIYGLFQ